MSVGMSGRSAGAPMNSAPANYRGLSIPCASPFGLAGPRRRLHGVWWSKSRPRRRPCRERELLPIGVTAPMNCRESNSETKRKVVIAGIYR